MIINFSSISKILCLISKTSFFGNIKMLFKNSAKDNSNRHRSDK